MSGDLHTAVASTIEGHQPGDDWHCTCGEDLFGGTAAYSRSLYLSHLSNNITAVAKVAEDRRADRAFLVGVDYGRTTRSQP